MVATQRHIAGFLTLLVCLSLGLSSLHNHEAFSFNSGNRQSNVSHTLNSDTSVCPVCGYLFHAKLPSPHVAEGVIRVQSTVDAATPQQFPRTALSCNQNRAPPLQV